MRTCACGGRLSIPDGLTGYWPHVPYRCDNCGTVTYLTMNKGAMAQKATVMSEYDSTQDTWEHIEKVRQNLFQVTKELAMRSALHDQSKLQSPEKEAHDHFNPRLRHAVYGSDEYKAILAEMSDIPKLHYAKNRHHPEYHSNGVNDMSLVDIIEMLCDWKAATERNNGDLAKSIEISIQRFGIGEQLAQIIRNTARDFGWIVESA